MTTCCTEQDMNGNLNQSLEATTRNTKSAVLFLSFRIFSIRVNIAKFMSWYVTRQERKISRDAFQHLLKLDDGLLDDIGVTRDAVRWAASLPLSEDAAQALEDTARRR